MRIKYFSVTMQRYAYLLYAVLVTAACNNDVTGLGPPSDPATETFAASLGVDVKQMTKMPNGVYYRDVTVGTGDALTDKADSVSVTYAGHLKDGTLFDSGVNQTFLLAELVAGLRTGMLGMKVGGKRKIVIPSALGYGGPSRKDPVTGKIIIPRQSTLIFDVDLVRFHIPSTTPATP